MAYFRTFLLAVLLLLSGTTAAQSGLYLEPRLGFGTFRMDSMKELQQTIIRSSGVNAKATDTFGPYFQFGLNGVYAFNERVGAGLFLEHGSTGGRVAYEDYSGELTLDTKVNHNALGLLFFTRNAIGESRFSYVIGIEASAFLSGLRVIGNSRVYTHTDSSDDYFSSLGFGVKPYAGLQYPVLSMPLRLTMGYLVNASEGFHVPGNRDQYLVKSGTDDKLGPNWSGLRINLTVSVPITK